MKGILELNKKELFDLTEKLNRMHEVDLAHYMEELDTEEILFISRLIKKEQLSEAFAELGTDYKQAMIEHLSDSELETVIQHLDSFELAETMREVPANIVKRLIRHIDANRRPLINQVLGYPEESVGSIMGVELVKCYENDTLETIIEKVKAAQFDAEFLQVIWVVNHSQQLQGFINVADLLRYQDQPLSELIKHDVISINTLADQEEAAKLMNKYHLSVLPVIDEEGCLVGVISTETVLDVIEEEFSEDIAQMQGVANIDDGYLEESAYSHFLKRIKWLLILMITATMTGYIIQRYDDIISTSVVLAAYIPMLMDSGGNAGGQATTVIIRSLTLGELDSGDILKIIWKELRIALMVGLSLAIINIIRIGMMDHVSLMVNLTVSLSLMCTIVMAKLVGAVLPFIGLFFKQDPVVMAGPLITTVVDTFALIIYFEIASLLLGI